MAMPNDRIKHLWKHGIHWAVKKNADRSWYRGKDDMEWKAGLPPGVKVQEANRTFLED